MIETPANFFQNLKQKDPRAIIPNLGLTTDLKNAADYTIATKIYPNPTNEGFNLEF